MRYCCVKGEKVGRQSCTWMMLVAAPLGTSRPMMKIAVMVAET